MSSHSQKKTKKNKKNTVTQWLINLLIHQSQADVRQAPFQRQMHWKENWVCYTDKQKGNHSRKLKWKAFVYTSDRVHLSLLAVCWWNIYSTTDKRLYVVASLHLYVYLWVLVWVCCWYSYIWVHFFWKTLLLSLWGHFAGPQRIKGYSMINNEVGVGFFYFSKVGIN